MSLQTASAKLTGLPDSHSWTQVHEFHPADPTLLKKRGCFYSVISVSQVNFEAPLFLGREILTRLHEEYFGNKDLSAYTALKKALEKILNEFGKEKRIEIAALAFLEDVAYIASAGGAKVKIFRDKVIATLLESEAESVIAASGYPQEGDIIFLGTSAFFEKVKEDTLQSLLETANELQEVVERIASYLHKKDKSGNVGLVVLSFGSAEFLKPIKVEKPSEYPFPSFIRGDFAKGSIFSVFFNIGRFFKKGRPLKLKSEPNFRELSDGKKTATSVAIILLVLLFVSVFFGIKQSQIKEKREKIRLQKEVVVSKLQEAETLFNTSPTRSLQVFEEGEAALNALEKIAAKDPEVLELKKNLEDKRRSIFGNYSVDLSSFFEFFLIGDFEASEAFSFQDRILLLDKERKKVLEIKVDEKKTRIVAGPNLIADPVDISAYGDRVFILEKTGIYELKNETKELIDSQEGDFLYAYAGNLYLLSKKEGSIKRYSGLGTGSFGPGLEWLADKKADFDDVISWAIDGNVWVLKASGEILKFSLGVKKDLNSNTNLTKGAVFIFSREDTNFIYLLKPSLGQIVVLDKNGNYKARYLNQDLKDAVSIVVYEKDRKLFVVKKNKVDYILLEHLD